MKQEVPQGQHSKGRKARKERNEGLKETSRPGPGPGSDSPGKRIPGGPALSIPGVYRFRSGLELSNFRTILFEAKDGGGWEDRKDDYGLRRRQDRRRGTNSSPTPLVIRGSMAKLEVHYSSEPRLKEKVFHLSQVNPTGEEVLRRLTVLRTTLCLVEIRPAM
eukprot:551517-Hanusia_phi.AAC.1